MCRSISKLEAQCVLHLPATVGGGLTSRSSKQRVANRKVRIGPHQQVPQVVCLEPELELVALLDRERFGHGAVNVPEDRPGDVGILIRVRPWSERTRHLESIRVEPQRRTRIRNERITHYVGLREAQELTGAIRIDP